MTEDQRHDIELNVKLVRDKLDGIYEQVYDDTCDEDQGITVTAIGGVIGADCLFYWCKEKRESIIGCIESAHDLLDEIEGDLE